MLTWHRHLVDFDHPHGAVLGILGTINTIGFITALPFTGYIADRLGRRMPIQIGSVIMLVGAAIQAASQNMAMFLVARYLLGFGISVAAVASPALVAKLLYPSYRGKITAIYNTNWFVRAIINILFNNISRETTNSLKPVTLIRVPRLIIQASSLVPVRIAAIRGGPSIFLLYRDHMQSRLDVTASHIMFGIPLGEISEGNLAKLVALNPII